MIVSDFMQPVAVSTIYRQLVSFSLVQMHNYGPKSAFETLHIVMQGEASLPWRANSSRRSFNEGGSLWRRRAAKNREIFRFLAVK
jgi:hypothetical protein